MNTERSLAARLGLAGALLCQSARRGVAQRAGCRPAALGCDWRSIVNGCYLLLTSLTMLLPAAALAQVPTPDHLTLEKPARLPALREVLDDATYTSQSAAVLEAFGDLDELAKSKRPAVGYEILEVVPDSPAVQLNIRVGDHIVQINDRLPWNHSDLGGDDPEEERSLVIVSPDGQRRTVTVQPGRMGVVGAIRWRPELLYLYGTQRDPRWDKTMVLALSQRLKQPHLAQTALKRALATGYPPDYLSASAAMMVVLADARPADAAAFAWHALQADESRGQLVAPPELYRVLIANAKLPAAAQLVATHPSTFDAVNPLSLRHLMRVYEDLSPDQRTLPPPSELAAGRRHISLIGRLRPAVPNTINRLADFLRKPLPQTVSVPSNHFEQLVFAPDVPVRDVETSVRFTIRPTTDEPSGFAKILEYILGDLEPWSGVDWGREGPFARPGLRQFRADALAQVSLQAAPPAILCSHSAMLGNRFGYLDPVIHADGVSENELRIVRVGGWVEGFVNGNRVLYVPVVRELDYLALMLKVVGATVEFRAVQFDEIVEPL